MEKDLKLGIETMKSLHKLCSEVIIVIEFHFYCKKLLLPYLKPWNDPYICPPNNLQQMCLHIKHFEMCPPQLSNDNNCGLLLYVKPQLSLKPASMSDAYVVQY